MITMVTNTSKENVAIHNISLIIGNQSLADSGIKVIIKFTTVLPTLYNKVINTVKDNSVNVNFFIYYLF